MFISDDILSTIFQFLPSKNKTKVLTSSKSFPNINLLTDIPDLDNVEICNAFTEDNFKILMKNVNLDRQKLFNCVVKRGSYKIVKILLTDSRVNPSINNNYALRWASKNGHTEIVKLLLADERVDPSDQNNQAIQISSFYGHADIVKLLLEVGLNKEFTKRERVNPADLANQAIRYASKNGHTEVVKLLLTDKRVDAL